MDSGVPGQVLDVMRDVLLAQMDQSDADPHFRIQSAVYIGRRSGRLISEQDCQAGHDEPGGLRLTMRSGEEYDLSLDLAEQREASDE